MRQSLNIQAVYSLELDAVVAKPVLTVHKHETITEHSSSILTGTGHSGGSGAERAGIPLTAGSTVEIATVDQAGGSIVGLLCVVIADLLMVLLYLETLLQLLEVMVIAVAGGGGNGVSIGGGRRGGAGFSWVFVVLMLLAAFAAPIFCQKTTKKN